MKLIVLTLFISLFLGCSHSQTDSISIHSHNHSGTEPFIIQFLNGEAIRNGHIFN